MELSEFILKRAHDFVKIMDSRRNKNSGICSQVTEIKTGKKYYKLISQGFVNGNKGQASVSGFVEIETGSIFKASTWSAPAKHPRGNVLSTSSGAEALDEQGFIYYLR